MLFRSNGSAARSRVQRGGARPGVVAIQPGDRFFIGDFNHDGKDEVVVYNSTDWAIEYLGLLADDGNNGLKLIARYDDAMPGWQFQLNDQFYVADFNGDGKKDLFVFNGNNWAIPYLGMLRSSGTGFGVVSRYDANMPGWQMRPGDRHMVGTSPATAVTTFGCSTGRTGPSHTSGMLRSNGTSLSMSTPLRQQAARLADARQTTGTTSGISMVMARPISMSSTARTGRSRTWACCGRLGTPLLVERYDGNAPGWQMRRNDRHWIADVNGDGKARSVRVQPQDWAPEYLGTMVSNGTGLSSVLAGGLGRRVEPRIGRPFRACELRGSGRPPGPLRPQPRLVRDDPCNPELSLQRIYYQWIHNYRIRP